MIVQIYEIQTPEEAERCLELGVDHVGSLLPSESDWRQPRLKETLGVLEGTPSRSSLIPLFREMDTLIGVLDYYQPDFIHFCENLVDDRGRERDLGAFLSLQTRIKERHPEVGIIRSLPIPRRGRLSDFPALRIAKRLEPVSDLFLTDTTLGKEPVEGFLGITGKTCDWEMARELVLRSQIPVILAGGLSPENVYEGLRKVCPAGADSCTQTNRVDGNGNPIRFKKDFVKVRKFVDEVRRAEAAMPGKRFHKPL